MAEVFEADNNSEMAMESYQQAADMFSNDNKKSNANQCLLKVWGGREREGYVIYVFIHFYVHVCGCMLVYAY
jgi:hypothetical protein